MELVGKTLIIVSQNNMTGIVRTIIQIIIIGVSAVILSVAASYVFAAWQGTDDIASGEVITDEVVRDNFNHLYALHDCGADTEGRMQYVIEDEQLQYCNGTSWIDISI